MAKKLVKFFLRISLGAGFLSASADRFGWWPKEYSAWGDWDSFLVYTSHLLSWIPDNTIPILGFAATLLEVVLGIFLIAGFKLKPTSWISGGLLLIFALSMTFADSIKSPLDASVFTASAAAFSIPFIKESFLEMDYLIGKNKKYKRRK